MSKLRQVAGLGQAIWLDYIHRSLISSGDLKALVDEGLCGVTSNPTIFERAIAQSADYDQDILRLAEMGKTIDEIYEALVLDDVGQAADVLRPVYERSHGVDGYVSLEVNPKLAHDTQNTIIEARRFFTALGRPNVLIKVPATPAGVPAIETLISEGISVNVTLIFSIAQYEAIAEAYMAGLEKRVANGKDVTRLASVASFFVSRVDTAVDRQLEVRHCGGEKRLQGKIAIANAKMAYARFREMTDSARWKCLAAAGAHAQRPLWASTSTKNPLYADTLYVDNLIGPDTVNTVPPATLDAFRDHGIARPTLQTGLEQARADLTRLAELGVDLGLITDKLQEEGVRKFIDSFETLTGAIAKKREALLAG